MQAKLKHYFDGAPKVVPGEGPGMWLECELTSPPSKLKQIVDVYVSEELIVPLMKELRDRAARARSKGEHE